MEETRYPLCWPASWKRTPNRTRAQFGKASWTPDGTFSYAGKKQLSIAQAIDRIADELRRMGVAEENVIVSTNVALNLSGIPRGDRAEPSDPGVAIYWKQRGKNQCMAIDRYTRVADNLAAVAATLEALRAIERHGGGSILERAFMGFAQLPAPIVTHRPWRVVLQIPEDAEITRDFVNERYRTMVKITHPDTAEGEHEAMVELNAARAEALKEANG